VVCRIADERWRMEAQPTQTPAPPVSGQSGEQIASTSTYAPSREDFAALLDESYGENESFEGSVIKGRGVAIEKDVAVIDLGMVR
jgi:hypothetical protein